MSNYRTELSAFYLMMTGEWPEPGEAWSRFEEVMRGLMAAAASEAVIQVELATAQPVIPLEHMQPAFRAGYEAAVTKMKDSMRAITHENFAKEEKARARLRVVTSSRPS